MRRWPAKLLAFAAPILTLACGGYDFPDLASPCTVRFENGITTFLYEDPVTPELTSAIDDAVNWWGEYGILAPRNIPIFLGDPPQLNADGYCYCEEDRSGSAVIVVVRPQKELIAHELGHAMGLKHVSGAHELMSPVLNLPTHIGPETLNEARRVGALW